MLTVTMCYLPISDISMYKTESNSVISAHIMCCLKGTFNSIQFSSIQFNSIQFNSIQFNSIQFNSFISNIKTIYKQRSTALKNKYTYFNQYTILSVCIQYLCYYWHDFHSVILLVSFYDIATCYTKKKQEKNNNYNPKFKFILTLCWNFSDFIVIFLWHCYMLYKKTKQNKKK